MLPIPIPCSIATHDFDKSQITAKGSLLQSTKAMILPVGPPTFLSALPTFDAAPAIAGPAEEATLDSPSCAFAAASFALLAASEVEEECLIAVLRIRNCDCRSTARDAAMDILVTTGLRREV